MQFTDKEIVEKYLEGDVNSFELLIKKYEKGIYNYCLRFTRDAKDAEDIAQQTFIKLFENIEKISLDGELKGWLYTVATNLCRSLHKKVKNINFTSLEGDEMEDQGSSENYFEDENVNIEKEVSAKELKEKVKTALAKLAPKYSSVLSLYYIEEFSYEEISEMLEIPLNTIRTHLKRAKDKLEELIGEYK